MEISIKLIIPFLDILNSGLFLKIKLISSAPYYLFILRAVEMWNNLGSNFNYKAHILYLDVS